MPRHRDNAPSCTAFSISPRACALSPQNQDVACPHQPLVQPLNALQNTTTVPQNRQPLDLTSQLPLYQKKPTHSSCRSQKVSPKVRPATFVSVGSVLVPFLLHNAKFSPAFLLLFVRHLTLPLQEREARTAAGERETAMRPSASSSSRRRDRSTPRWSRCSATAAASASASTA